MKKNKLKKDAYTNFALVSQIGIHILVPIFACVAIGVFIDGKYNTYLTLPLLILGILAGGRNAYTLAKSVNRKSDGQLESEEEQRIVNEAVEKWKEGKQFTGNDNTERQFTEYKNEEKQFNRDKCREYDTGNIDTGNEKRG